MIRRQAHGKHTPEVTDTLNKFQVPAEHGAPSAGALLVATGPVQSFTKNRNLFWLAAASGAKGIMHKEPSRDPTPVHSLS